MKSTKIILIIVILLVITAVYMSVSKTDQMNETVVPVTGMEENDAMKYGDDLGMEDGVAMVAGSYEAYAPEKLASAETGDVVLFFRASWCPTCKALDEDIKANTANIPSDLTILDVDYDKFADLKKKYEVTTQHTLVQVDKDGNMLKKWTGGVQLVDLVSKVQ